MSECLASESEHVVVERHAGADVDPPGAVEVELSSTVLSDVARLTVAVRSLAASRLLTVVLLCGGSAQVGRCQGVEEPGGLLPGSRP